jgi:hypothetical protein
LISPPTDFGPWGGAISFDTGGTNWYFGQALPVPSTAIDFYSVALHEIGHILGIGDIPSDGSASSWTTFVSGGSFVGPAAEQANGGAPVPLDAALHHWADGTISAGAEAAMTPILDPGTRKLFTPLDFAGLTDIGWQVSAPAATSLQFGTPAWAVSESAGSAAVFVNRSGDLNSTVTVNYAASDGTATSGVDYTATSGTLTFGPGVSVQSFNVPILQDGKTDNDETFLLSLSKPSPGNAVLGATVNEVMTILEVRPKLKETPLADFDGDRKSDIAAFRPTSAVWLLRQSSAGGKAVQFGQAPGDIPVPGDYDGDGKIDFALYRPSTATWYIQFSTGGSEVVPFGQPGVDIPVPADFDGDGKTDIAVFRPTTGEWFLDQSSSGTRYQPFGGPGDIPVPADYSGDGRAEIAVYRPSTAQWFIMLPSGGQNIVQFGQPGGDKPIPADYDGDGKADIAVFRPTTAEWFLDRSSAGPIRVQFGAGGLDVPVPADYDGDGKTDLAVFRPTTAEWFVSQTTAGPSQVQFGQGGVDVPLAPPLVYRYPGSLHTSFGSGGGGFEHIGLAHRRNGHTARKVVVTNSQHAPRGPRIRPVQGLEARARWFEAD